MKNVQLEYDISGPAELNGVLILFYKISLKCGKLSFKNFLFEMFVKIEKCNIFAHGWNIEFVQPDLETSENFLKFDLLKM